MPHESGNFGSEHGSVHGHTSTLSHEQSSLGHMEEIEDSITGTQCKAPYTFVSFFL